MIRIWSSSQKYHCIMFKIELLETGTRDLSLRTKFLLKILLRGKCIMLQNYFINNETYVFYSSFDNNGFEHSMVIEKEQEFQVKKSPIKIVQESFEHIGSDYEGAIRGARAILNRRNHIPVVFSASTEIVLLNFPTIDQLGRVWIVNKYIYDVRPCEEKTTTIIQMVNGRTIQVGMKFQLVHDRCIQATYLQRIALLRHP